MLPDPDDVVLHLRRHRGLRTRPLAEGLGVAAEELEPFLELLLELQARGEVLKLPHQGWTIPDETEFRVGTIRLSRGGTAFVSLARDDRRGDVRVRPEGVRDAFDGDVVMVRLAEAQRRKTPRRKTPRRGRRGRPEPREAPGRPTLREGRVVEVLRRHPHPVPGRFFAAASPGTPGRERTTAGFVRPLSRRMPTEIYVAPEDSAGARDGEKVLVRLLPGESHGVYPRGKVTVRIEDEGSLESDFQVITEEFGFPVEHSPEAAAEAAALPALGPAEVEEEIRRGRLDLRGLHTFTIDPADARDFDDAVSLETLPGGGLRLGVHIADVSRYAPAGSALDRSAEARGTSIYLPGRVVPMLPARLADDLCSLRPEVDRLTKTVFLDFGPEGGPAARRIEPSVIRSRRRFDYGEALAILDEADRRRGGPRGPRAVYPRDRRGKETAAENPPAALPADTGEYLEVFAAMAGLRDRLWRIRRERGALDLDIPRMRMRLDAGGQVISLEREERDPSHHLIEEFMLAANEAVAAHCGERGIPLVSRIHPPPDEDRLEDFYWFLERCRLARKRGSGSHDLQRIVEETTGEPLAPVIHLSLLRTLSHALYSPRPELHFALATPVYCHFTSPIRRYPDLLVHQALEEHRDGKLKGSARRAEWEEALPEKAQASSETERRAEEAEREMTKLRLIRHLRPRLGERMEAMVISVHPFGFFAREEKDLIEGLVHVSTLGDDYYLFDEDELKLRGQRSGRTFAVGDRVRVELSELDPDLREINFRYIGRAGRG